MRWLRVPRHGTVVAYLALFVALGGTAYAANTVGSKDIIDNSVQSKDIRDQTITTKDIAGIESSGLISLSGIANGRCTQVTFNMGGAEPGQSAIVSTGAAIQNGIVLYAQRVSSAGHVEVNACNFSGSTMTPISSFPVKVVTFG